MLFPPLGGRFELLEDALRSRARCSPRPTAVEGTHVARGAFNIPQPLRGDIPILIGGTGERKTLRMVAQHADGCNIFGDLDASGICSASWTGHCEDVGRDPAEITKTRMATVFLDDRHEAAVARLEASSLNERMRAMAIAGDPDGVGEQVQALMDAGIEGLTIRLTNAYDLEVVARAGETLAPLLAARV